MSQKIFIKTFGCQMNEYDSNRIYDSVKKIGYQKTENYVEISEINSLNFWYLATFICYFCPENRILHELSSLGTGSEVPILKSTSKMQQKISFWTPEFAIFELNIGFYVKFPPWGRALRPQFWNLSPGMQEISKRFRA